MRIYRQLYGDHPPDGDIALAYYQTLYGTASGKQAAIAGMRALADRNPGDPRYAVAAGHHAHLRPAHARRRHSHSPGASRRSRRASRACARRSSGTLPILPRLPSCASISRRIRRTQELADAPQAERVQAGADELRHRAHARRARRLRGAQRAPPRRSRAALHRAPRSRPEQRPRRRRHGFPAHAAEELRRAISYLTQAEQNGYKVKTVETALATSRFWFTMSEATQALDDNQLDRRRHQIPRRARHESAQPRCAQRPRRPLHQAAAILRRRHGLSSSSSSPARFARRLARPVSRLRARQSERQGACRLRAFSRRRSRPRSTRIPSICARSPPSIRPQNRTADAQRVLALALALPFPDNGARSRPTPSSQYAGILMEAKHYDQAARALRAGLHERSRQCLRMDGPASARITRWARTRGHRRRAEDARRPPTKPRWAIPASWPCSAPSISRPINLKLRRDCSNAP